jgi:DMSO reductase family type II enzyme heme b subunit
MGIYKFRSTASGTPPTDDDLFQTITKGLPGTNMPDWQHLDEAVRWQLAYYLKSLSPVFQQTEPAPVTLAADPGVQRADLAKGRQIYEQLGCAACHGNQGRANGTSAAGLVDDWGLPIRPANLTQGWSYRGGADPRSVTLRFLTGIDGAGMPSYAEAILAEDAWHLAYYVVSLEEPPHWNMIAHPLRVEGALPATLDDPRWAKAERTDVRLRNAVTAEGEWPHPPTVKAVGFQAVYHEAEIAFRVTWDDPTKDAANPPDRLALVLKPAASQGDVVTLQAWPYQGAPVLDFCHWAAETGSAGEWLGNGFEPDMVAVPLPSAAAYDDGRWQLVIQRAFQPAAPAGVAAIKTDGFTSIAFVVWDGGNPEARAVSPWVEIAIREERRE